jgi:hypothetical protein
MGGTEMKWVWDSEKHIAINLENVNSIIIEPHLRITKQPSLVEAHTDEETYILGYFDSEQAAQKFISNLTGAANGGQS